MAKEIQLPDLGEGVEGGDIINILIKEGDIIQKDDPLLELETDKATLEVPSPAAGKVEKIVVKTGDNVQIGQVVVLLSEGKTSTGQKPEPSKNADKKKTSANKTPLTESTPKTISSEPKRIPVEVPDMGDGVGEADVIGVLVKVGDEISADDPILEVETDKATVEIPSEKGGKVVAIPIKVGDKVHPGKVMLEIETVEVDTTPPSPVAEPEKPESIKTETSSKKSAPEEARKETNFMPSSYTQAKKIVPAAPSVRRFAREIGIDITEVPGTGYRGRISIDDVKKYSKDLNRKRKNTSTLGVSAQPLPDFSKWGIIERQEMSKIRTLTANSMSHAWNTIPHVTQFDKADITELEALRKQFKPRVEQVGGKLTITAILIKVLALAMKKYPHFNVSVDMAKNEIVQKHYCHIGVAVNTEHGLLVPVIRDADQKNITQLALDLTDYSSRARTRKIRPDELQGGCITITNLGGIAGTGFTPIVNWPEVAILGVSKSETQQAHRKNGSFEPALMMPLSLSYDHRVIDGVAAALFLRDIVETLENPFLLSLEGW